MMILGGLSALGSIISLLIPLPGHEHITMSLVLTKLFSGFFLGFFGGSAIFDYFAEHAPEGFSITSIIGLVVLVISILGIPSLQALYLLGQKWLQSKRESNEDKF